MVSRILHQISIPTGRAGVYAFAAQTTALMSSATWSPRSSHCLATAAEEIVLADLSPALKHIQRVTNITRNMITRYGMSDVLGPVVYGSEHGQDEVFLGRDFSTIRNYSEETASKIDAEIRRIVDNAYATARKILEDHKEKLHFIAAYLFKNEVMDQDQFNAVMEGDPTVEELNAIAEEKRRRERRKQGARKAGRRRASRQKKKCQTRSRKHKNLIGRGCLCRLTEGRQSDKSDRDSQ